jgi:eukaryotic-like serine/threonine-protein kinase
VALVVGAVLVVALLGWFAYSVGRDGGGDGAGDGGQVAESTKPSGDGKSSSTPDPEPEVTAAGMETFIRDYLAMVTTDTRAAYEELTPEFQAASGNYGGYKGFWKTIESAQVLSVDADPETRQVTYTVEYVRNDGSSTTDEVTLQLEGTDGVYLISDEA